MGAAEASVALGRGDHYKPVVDLAAYAQEGNRQIGKPPGSGYLVVAGPMRF